MNIKKGIILGCFFSITQLFGQTDTNVIKLDIILGSWKLVESKIDSSANNSISQDIIDEEIYMLTDSCITFKKNMKFTVDNGAKKGKFKFGEEDIEFFNATYYQLFLNGNEYYFVLDKDNTLIVSRRITENYGYRFRFVRVE